MIPSRSSLRRLEMVFMLHIRLKKKQLTCHKGYMYVRGTQMFSSSVLSFAHFQHKIEESNSWFITIHSFILHETFVMEMQLE